MTISKLLPGAKENVSLAKYTTFKIGGPARYFYVAETAGDLIRAIKAAQKCQLPFFILGGGSNLLAADEGYNGLVIKFQVSSFKFQDDKIIVGAGISLGKLVKFSAEKSLTGLEWAAGIPGTVGGAVRGNAGAFGSCMADVVKSVEVLDVRTYKIPNSKSQILNKSQIPNPKFKIKNFENKDCKFGYRDSIFKHRKNLIILSAEIRLKTGNKDEIKAEIKENLMTRQARQPSGPSAGSIFKNLKSKIQNKKLLKSFPELKKFVKNGAIPSAALIEKCGLKGKRIGGAEISKKHANFIVNSGNAKAKDVKRLIDFVKKKVKNKFGIVLAEEITILSEAKNGDPALSNFLLNY